MCTLLPSSQFLWPVAILRPRPKFKCSNEILSISSMLSVPNVFVRPKEFGKARFPVPPVPDVWQQVNWFQ